MTRLIKRIKDVKDVLAQSGRTVGFVPTLGALHDGHISLINTCRVENKTSVVSIFINPLQFSPNEDFDKYPRDEEGDLKKCEKNSVDYLFYPDAEEIYPNENKEIINPPAYLANELCGKTRKNHFSGVATVIKRLFNIIEPENAYFGEKDLQQLYVIRWLVNEHKLPITIKPCPTIRERTGLALSSRTVYLTQEEKALATSLYKSLVLAKNNVKSGIFSISKSILESLIYLSQFSKIKIEYFEARDKKTFTKADDNKNNGFYFLIAAKIGNVRLIDNIEV